MSAGTRPVVPGFHPDPSVCVVDGVYLMACSSFEYAPGIPLFRSTDLREWEPAGHVLDRPEQLVVTDAGRPVASSHPPCATTTGAGGWPPPTGPTRAAS